MKPPAFQFYPSDFLASTAEMTAEEVGVHIRLLCHQWIKGGLPNDDARLASMAGQCGGNAIAYAKTRFRICEDGQLRHPRLEAEREKQAEYRAKQAGNANKRWHGNATAYATAYATALPTHMPNACSPSPSPSPSQTPSQTPETTLRIKSGGVGGGEPSSPVSTAKKKAVRKTQIPDEAWIASLEAEPAYQGIAVRREVDKCRIWCQTRQKSFSKQRVINWLGRAEPNAINGHHHSGNSDADKRDRLVVEGHDAAEWRKRVAELPWKDFETGVESA